MRGLSLSVILKAGDWRSSAFSAYLDSAEIEAKAALNAVLDKERESESEGDEGPTSVPVRGEKRSCVTVAQSPRVARRLRRA